MMSDIGTFPDILREHPAMKLCVKFTEALAPFQQDVLSIMAEHGIEGLDIRALLDLNIQPLPSLQALYRENKQSIQRVAQLGTIARSFKDLVELNHERITVESVAPSYTNVFQG